MKLLILLCLAVVLEAQTTGPEQKQAYLVYPYKCLSIDKDSKVEVPWVNGEPDYKQAKVYNVHLAYDRDCIFAYTKIK